MSCSLVNYGRDCKNKPIQDLFDSVSHSEELKAALKGAKESLRRVDKYFNDILESDYKTIYAIWENLQSCSNIRHIAIMPGDKKNRG